jgi:hypothetical protein
MAVRITSITILSAAIVTRFFALNDAVTTLGFDIGLDAFASLRRTLIAIFHLALSTTTIA